MKQMKKAEFDIKRYGMSRILRCRFALGLLRLTAPFVANLIKFNNLPLVAA